MTKIKCVECNGTGRMRGNSGDGVLVDHVRCNGTGYIIRNDDHRTPKHALDQLDTSVSMAGDSLSMDQEIVKVFRRVLEPAWPTPQTIDSIRFVFQELGELDSILMRQGYQLRLHQRNHDDPYDLDHAMRLELGQAYMMLLTLANNLGVNLQDCLSMALSHAHGKWYPKLTDQES